MAVNRADACAAGFNTDHVNQRGQTSAVQGHLPSNPSTSTGASVQSRTVQRTTDVEKDMAIAKQALEYVQGIISGAGWLGSSTKITAQTVNDLPQSSSQEKERCNIADRAIIQLREKMKPKKLRKYVDAIKQAKCGNCFELAVLAEEWLSKKQDVNKSALYIVELTDKSHAFVAMNQKPDRNNRFLQSFADWNANAMVIDPLYEVCAPAHQFLEALEAKLSTLTTTMICDVAGRWFPAMGQQEAFKNGMKALAHKGRMLQEHIAG